MSIEDIPEIKISYLKLKINLEFIDINLRIFQISICSAFLRYFCLHISNHFQTYCMQIALLPKENQQ